MYKKMSVVLFVLVPTILVYGSDQENKNVQQLKKIYAVCAYAFHGIKSISTEVPVSFSVEEKVAALIKAAHVDYPHFEKHAESDLYCTVHAAGYFEVAVHAADGSKRTVKQWQKMVYDKLEDINSDLFDCIAECPSEHSNYIAINSKKKS